MGFNLNRYKFAQQLPIHEVKPLALGKPLLENNSNSTEERIGILKDTLKDGIYFIGLTGPKGARGHPMMSLF